MENNKSEFLKNPIEKKQIIYGRGDFKGSCENGYKNERDF